MNEHPPKEEILHLIREIGASPEITQRDLSIKLRISLGKTNYLIKELIKRGSVSIKNFSSHDAKIKKVMYILTKKGLVQRANLTYHFLKKKEAEFNHMKAEWERLQVTAGTSNRERT